MTIAILPNAQADQQGWQDHTRQRWTRERRQVDGNTWVYTVDGPTQDFGHGCSGVE